MAATHESLALLRSIDASLRRIADKLDPQPVNDRICDGKYGDPEVRQTDPRDWTGDSMKGRRFSECPPEYLDLLAERFDYFASKEEDTTKQKYNLLDAQRARAWAARVRNGYRPPTTATAQGEPTW